MGYATFTKCRFDLCHGIISLVFLTDQCPNNAVEHVVTILEGEADAILF